MSEQSLSKDELQRYSRHLVLPNFGIEGQKRLKKARVLVIGAGGLGAPLLQYLAAAGIGTLGIVDFDVVEASNLQRQILFSVADVGRLKVEAAKERLLGLNPTIEVITHPHRLTAANALEILGQYDVVADGSDNFPTRYLVNDACVLLNKPNVYASIFRFEGQLSVFNVLLEDGTRGPNYRDVFPTPPPAGSVPSCEEGGVIGVLPGMLGTMQANEVVKLAAGIGEPLSGKLLMLDALTLATRMLMVSKHPKNPISGVEPTQTGLIDYEAFCRMPSSAVQQEITVQQLQQWRAAGRKFQLIDVRESSEYDAANLGGELIPLGTILEQISRISTELDVVVYCRSGKRSAAAIQTLETAQGFSNLYNLRGGIEAWIAEVDPDLGRA